MRYYEAAAMHHHYSIQRNGACSSAQLRSQAHSASLAWVPHEFSIPCYQNVLHPQNSINASPLCNPPPPPQPLVMVCCLPASAQFATSSALMLLSLLPSVPSTVIKAAGHAH